MTTNAPSFIKAIATDSKSLAADVKKACTAATTAQSLIHVALLGALFHWREHGNSTPLVDLLNGLPKSQRTTHIRSWVCEFFPVEIKGQKPKSTQDFGAEAWGNQHFEAAFSEPFYEWKKDPTQHELTLDGFIKWLATRANPESKVNVAAECVPFVEVALRAVQAEVDRREGIHRLNEEESAMLAEYRRTRGS